MSNLINRINQIILEARRNPEQNPKISTLENLKKYYGKGLYVTFKSLEKVGVNPHAKWGHMSPIGVFAYPVEFVYDKLVILRDNPSFGEYNLPFAFDKRYIYVLQQTEVPGLKFIKNAAAYNNEDLHRDIQKLTPKNIESKLHLKMYKDSYSFEEVIDSILKDHTYDPPIRILFRITNEISKFLNTNSERITKDEESNGHLATIWNSLFRVVLEYSGIADPDNIHPAHEDINYETIFFTSEAYRVIDSFDNDYWIFKTAEKNKKYSSLKIVPSLVRKLMRENQSKATISIDDNTIEVDMVEGFLQQINKKIYYLDVLSPGYNKQRTSHISFDEFIYGLLNSYYDEYPTTFKINTFINKLKSIIVNNRFGSDPNSTFEGLYRVFLAARDDLYKLYLTVYKMIELKKD
jgi:hypothetical protein